jgi:hypothetical protein
MADDQKELAAATLAALLKLTDQTGDAAAIDSTAISESMKIKSDHVFAGVEANNARADAWFILARLAGALTYNPATPDRERLQSAAINAVERWRIVA